VEFLGQVRCCPGSPEPKVGSAPSRGSDSCRVCAWGREGGFLIPGGARAGGGREHMEAQRVGAAQHDCPRAPLILRALGPQDTTVTIIPNFRMDAVPLVGGDVGPFQPNFPTEVPLWLALTLR